MPVLAIFDSVLTRDQYQTLRAEVNWETDQPDGVLSHVAGMDADGHIHVADLWESEDQMNAFVGQRLMPAFQKHGITPPQVSMYNTVNINAYAAIDKHRVGA